MLGLCCDKTYGTMKNYNNGDDDGYNNEKNGNDNENAVSGSGSSGLIFDPITMPGYPIGGLDKDGNGNGAADVAKSNYVSTRWNIYLTYKDHTLLYKKTGLFGLMLLKYEKVTS